MSFQYKTVLIIGATSGIGLALAEKMIENGSFVIAVGRRQERLDSLVQKHGQDKIASFKFDITDLKGTPAFVDSVTKAHPKLDSVLINSGIQRGLDFSKPEEIDLDSIGEEMLTNYTSYIHLVKYFLPFLQAQSVPTSLIFTTSGLALMPITRCPNYCASKAALHHLILCMREQLSGSNVKVIELLPPAVQTELHDEKHQPDIKNGGSIGIPLAEYTEKTWDGLIAGEEDIPVGMSAGPYQKGGFENLRREQFAQRVEMMKQGKF